MNLIDLINYINDIDEDLIIFLKNMDDTFQIEIPEGIFYSIKDLGEGNYLTVNENGEVYELLHDPYSVKRKASNIHDLLQ
jgi:hypothetical protein